MGLAEYVVALGHVFARRASGKSKSNWRARIDERLLLLCFVVGVGKRSHHDDTRPCVGGVSSYWYGGRVLGWSACWVDCVFLQTRYIYWTRKFHRHRSAASAVDCLLSRFATRPFLRRHIVKELAEHNVAVRQGSFLSTEQLQSEMGFEHVPFDSRWRITILWTKCDFVMDLLEEIPGW